MPFRKNRSSGPPKWEKAKLNGLRRVIFNLKGDEYRGEWKDNKKHGKGKFIWKATGTIYEGSWEDDKQQGFGVINIPLPQNKFRQYIGRWKDNKFHGYGTLCYSETEYYEGEFEDNLRHGWGKMHWANGDVYEGEWSNDLRHGRGMLDYANGQRVQCHWFNDKKFGAGKHYFPLTGQLLRGYWHDDICKTGTIEDVDWQTTTNKTRFSIPECKLSDIQGVVYRARSQWIDSTQDL